MSDARTQPPAHGLDLRAGILAVILPGLGHAARGEVKRGVLACVSVLAMFFGGMLIGGIDVIDREEDKWWFVGQAFVGPIAFGVNWAHQTKFKAYGIQPVPASAGSTPVYETTELKLLGPHRLRSVYPRETRRMADVEVRTPAGQLIETRRLPVAVPISAGESVPNRKSLAKVNELGTLYALCAGMLNLIVILDALFPTTGGQRGANAHAANAKSGRAGSQTGKGDAA